MKKRYLKTWIEYSIICIQFLLFLILCSECNNFKIFVISKIIALIIFYINHLILEKYTRLFD